MKAEDLMIGDWVKHDNNDVIVTVQEIHPSYIFVYPESRNMGYLNKGYEVPIEELVPIPLTPEILEKNGFSQDLLNGHIFIFHEKSGEVIYYEYGQKYGLTIDNQLATIQDLKIKFVHELQHALRLCKIDKTIEL